MVASVAMGASSSQRRRAANEGGGPASSGRAFQKAFSQILVIEKTVSRPTSSATPARTNSSLSIEAWISSSFAQKPDSGGKPASENAGTKNSAASSGLSR